MASMSFPYRATEWQAQGFEDILGETGSGKMEMVGQTQWPLPLSCITLMSPLSVALPWGPGSQAVGQAPPVTRARVALADPLF